MVCVEVVGENRFDQVRPHLIISMSSSMVAVPVRPISFAGARSQLLPRFKTVIG
ncbi:hypothetical protein T492DRAFT_944692 [Pavlovales sp. CCMP2436]|nr:hypothetical protein T492DRAFT_944692 [Pavlovales sp. CCMP2436]